MDTIMIRIGMFICLFLLNATFIFSQTTYYVSSSQGNDANAGTSENAPWKTIAKVNSNSFNAGDQILFKRGDIWVGEQLFINRSGTSSERIKYASYGDGLKPIITLREEVPGTWVETSSGSHNWYVDFPSFSQWTPVDRLWADGVEQKFSYGETFGTTYSFYNDWGGSSWSNRLHFYSTTDPNSGTIEYAGGYSVSDALLQVISLVDADYVTLTGLDIQGGIYASIELSGSDHVKITNCNVGKYSNRNGIAGDRGYGNDRTSDYVEISNDTIDSYWNYNYTYYTQRTPLGILAAGGTSYWDIHDNYIKNWWMCIELIGVLAASQFHEVYNNDISAPDFSAGKAMQIASGGTMGTPPIYAKVYNNRFHHITEGIQISSIGNKIYYNIFDNTIQATNTGYGGDYGQAIQIEPDVQNVTPDSNYIFNNTFYNLYNEAQVKWASYPYCYNNLYLNTYMKSAGYTAIQQTNVGNSVYKNNLFFKIGSSSSSKFVNLTTTYSVSEFNAISATDSVLGNIYPTDYTMSQIINSDFTLPVGSPALNAGIDISSLVPTGFIDRFGNVVDRKNPNIGATANSALEPAGFKVYLQGAYNDRIMKTVLKEGGLIPKAQPYNISPWNYNGNETVQTIPSEIVDWVLIELRSDISSSSIVAKRAAFVRSDGSIVDLDGINKLRFDGIGSGNYYVVIRHRNHLSLMSAVQVPFYESSINYDFTSSRSRVYGNDLADLGNGKYGMYAGDGDANGTVNVLDYGTVGSNLFQTGYMQGDLDVNGTVNVLDYGKTNSNLLKFSNVP